jgi:hypothetical protein
VGAFFTFGNGDTDQVSGQSHTFNMNGKALFGLSGSYSYQGTFWKPGVYQIMIGGGPGAGGSVSLYDTNTNVHDVEVPTENVTP